jgi:monoamine oxidase
MARTPLFQRLLKLTSMAQNAREEGVDEIEFTEQQFFTRRKFIQTSAMASLAATVLASCAKMIDDGNLKSSSVSNALASTPSVVIVGAGVAGLNAAFNLKNAGIPSTLYDANTRAGGRMFTAQNILNPGLSTELGGEFIDTDHYEIRALAKYFGLPLLDLYSASELELTQNIYYFNGIAYTDKDFLKAIVYYLPAINRDAGSLSDIVKYNSYTPIDQKFDNMNLIQYFDSINLTGWLRELLLIAYIGEYGLNADQCDAINFLYLFGLAPNGKPALYGMSDERFKVAGGNQQIVDALYNTLKDQVNLEYKLVKIESKGEGYTLYFENKPKPVSADIVLLSLPFTLLREVEIDVELPQVKRQAINTLGYGNNSKLMLGFKNRIWRTKYDSVGMSYSDNGTENTWDNSQLQPGDAGGLTVYLGGDSAVNLGNGDVNVQAFKALDKLNQIYPGITADYNHKAYRMVWPRFKFTKASYSAWTVGQYTTIAGSEIETVGNLYFAGEHTSYDFQGYMNGGAVTGHIAANKIQKKISSFAGR